jgi:hypothetical protein
MREGEVGHGHPDARQTCEIRCIRKMWSGVRYKEMKRDSTSGQVLVRVRAFLTTLCAAFL